MILTTFGGSGPNLDRSTAGAAGGSGRDSHTSAALLSVRCGSGGVAGRGVHTWWVRLRDGGVLRDGDGEETRAGLLITRYVSFRCLRCCAGVLFSLSATASGIATAIVIDLSAFHTTETWSSERTEAGFSSGRLTLVEARALAGRRAWSRAGARSKAMGGESAAATLSNTLS